MSAQTVIRYTSIVSDVARNQVAKPDENGYYSIILGGFNVYNSSGAYYPVEPVKKLFEDSSVLMRRIRNGQLRSEFGHPVRKPGESIVSFISRLPVIDEKNVCAHIKEVSLEYTGTERDPVYVRGKIKPSGPYGDKLKSYLDNPDENVAFSIRSITVDRIVNGVVVKHIKEIYTWDYVNEPGIRKANQWADAGLESVVATFEEDACILSIDDIRQALKDRDSLSMESTNCLTHLIHSIELDTTNYLTSW